MKANEIRNLFLTYFAKNQHNIVASGSLVPKEDPSLLFTNAGMNQFKNIFLGYEIPTEGGMSSVVTSQKCVRAGGKHNDLDNVGYTARHHTFFEMLGNFSFGEYFKERAIALAWNFLTNKLNLPQDKLYITVYENDKEAYDIWQQQIGIAPNHLIKIGDNQGAPFASDNFWQMGETGPCGPCTEIFYDHGEQIAGGKPGTAEADGDRFVEIWNIVFMQYNRKSDGEMLLLDKPCIDTGMGLERIAAVMQGVTNNYDIDLFQKIITPAQKLLAVTDANHPSLKVIADHIRASVFLIADGVLPANEGRGYVLRRIIRRALRHGYKLVAKDNFFYKLVPYVISEMAEAYPELATNEQLISETIKQEEVKFSRTLINGIKLLENYLPELTKKQIPGDFAFLLYDTYGFPLDITQDIASEHGFTVDTAEFETCLQQQRDRAKGASKFTNVETATLQGKVTNFHGYEHLHYNSSIIGLLKNEINVAELEINDTGIILLENTPFYAESGGQAGDKGLLVSGDNIAEVIDTQKQGETIMHLVRITQGNFNINDSIMAKVDIEKRKSTACNHSATHLLHSALRKILGKHIQQKGSLVNSDRLRFDFSHPSAVSANELIAAEQLVNQQIRQNTAVVTNLMDYADAVDSGAIALFGEKYSSKVRVLTMGDDNFSVELCGGTHVNRTGDIGFFKIISETGIAAGIRRIEAITGEGFIKYQHEQQNILNQLSTYLNSATDELPNKLDLLINNYKNLEKQLATKNQKLLVYQTKTLITQAVESNGIKVLFAKVTEIDTKSLRSMIDILKQQLNNAVICLATVTDKGVSLAVGVSKQLTEKIHAGKLLNAIATELNGKGGGRADFAQGAGSNIHAIDSAFNVGKQLIKDTITP